MVDSCGPVRRRNV